jgi:hypothetical protein
MARATFLVFFFLLACVPLRAAEIKPIYKLNEAELHSRLQTDAFTVEMHRDGLLDVIHFMESRPDLFPIATPSEKRLLRREEKEVVWNTWQRFLDYTVALDSLEKYHANFFRLKGAAQEDSFFISYAAMLAKYRTALELIDRVEHNPELDKVLNDAVPELGLPAGTYSKLKFKYLNVAIATQFAASEVVMKTFPANHPQALRAGIHTDAEYLWKAGRGRNELLTTKNALKVLQNGADTAWFPIQAGVSEWMGDTKVYRIGSSLVSEKQVHELQPKLLPGDVILIRHEWYLSNVGLPGFWPHAALYIGTPEERRAFFADADTQAWVKQQGETTGDLEALLQLRSPEAYKNSIAPQQHERVVRIIEAISEGVSLTALEHAMDCDSLVVLRPRLPKAEKAQALIRAFHYVGRPYDFNFDFSTDGELVCTELVYKSYEPATDFTGLKLPTVEMLGRKVTPANEIVKQFDAQYGTEAQQFDMILFLDGQERQQRAVESTLAEFRQSCQRPKWHVIVQL